MISKRSEYKDNMPYHSLGPFIDNFHKTVFEWRNEFIMSDRVRVLNCLYSLGDPVDDIESLPIAVRDASKSITPTHLLDLFRNFRCGFRLFDKDEDREQSHNFLCRVVCENVI